MRKFRKFSHARAERWEGKHRFEHWYRDNSVYFITSKVRDGLHLFARDEPRRIFWDRFAHWTLEAGFTPWVTTLLSNHYHVLGYLKRGENLGPMMRKFHGSAAWMVGDHLNVRHKPFWRERGGRDYFDGCIRDVLQAERAYRYTLNQAVRARLVRDWRDYPDTRVNVEMWRAIRRAVELKAFMEGVPYARYERRNEKRRTQLS
jgi:hypothetical protein